jgi:hypothetical protein
MYQNIEKFLKLNGFKVISFNDNLYQFEFDNTILKDKLNQIAKLENEADNLFKPDANKETRELETKLWGKIWTKKKKLHKEFYPKLLPLFDALSLFYSNKKIEYKYQIKIKDSEIICFYLGRNSSYDESINNEEFQKRMSIELAEFDKFLKLNYF